jgi:hypothetical protein
MYLYFKNRIDKRLDAEKLLDNLRGKAESIVKELIPEFNRVSDRNITLIENKIMELQKILETADKRILLMKKETKKETDAGKVYATIRAREETPVFLEQPVLTSEIDSETAPVAEIVDLYRKGISPELIANKLSMPVGEVELTIAMRKGRT